MGVKLHRGFESRPLRRPERLLGVGASGRNRPSPELKLDRRWVTAQSWAKIPRETDAIAPSRGYAERVAFEGQPILPPWLAGTWLRRAGFVGVSLAPAALVLVGGGFRDRSTGAAALFAFAVSVPLLARRRWPVAVLAWLLLVAAVAGPIATLPVLLAVYSVALDGRRDVMLGAAVAAGLVLLSVSHALPGGAGSPDRTLSLLTLVGAVVAAGRWQGTRAKYVEQLRERAERLEREHALLAEQAVAEERVRMARELHDVVGHSVSLMVVQAQAQALTAGDTEHDRAALLSLADSGRKAMTELHRMLGVLRVGEGDAGGELAPQPGLGELDALVADARAAGVDARLSIEGARLALPATVDLSAYRIAQEALTNVVRHAGTARAEITLRYGPAQVELRVEDDGGTPPRAASTVRTAPAEGHGLVGMRERVALFGGSLEAHPRRDGPGYVVHAVLPLGELA